MTEAELRERLIREVFFDERMTDGVLSAIESAGFVVVRADQLLWLQKANYHGPQWVAEHPLPERTDGE